ncbi:MAG: hypothetical protein IPP10_12860 [Candidatus Competibacteraceae bacterium]|nr:hypothetical protein [Candidatus Competibacteraceae bacterium]
MHYHKIVTKPPFISLFLNNVTDILSKKALKPVPSFSRRLDLESHSPRQPHARCSTAGNGRNQSGAIAAAIACGRGWRYRSEPTTEHGDNGAAKK